MIYFYLYSEGDSRQPHTCIMIERFLYGKKVNECVYALIGCKKVV